MDRTDLERLDREALVLRAQAAGIRRARVLTRPELIDELIRQDPVVDEAQLKRSRGFFGRARDLLSRVVERGLHLPDAADRFRSALGTPLPQVPRPEPQAVPTVTLAEIYAAQGHRQRAIETLERVLEEEPEHGAARALLERFEASDYVDPARPLPPEAEDGERMLPGIPSGERDVASEPPDEIGAYLGRTESADPSAATQKAPRVPKAPRRAEAPSGRPAPVTPRVDEPVTLPRQPPPRGERKPAPLDGQDECVAISMGADGVFVWWRVSNLTRGELAKRTFVVRAVVVTPSWDGPAHETRDVSCDVEAGELVLEGLPERAIVRVAVGWLDAGAFTPVAHSPSLELTPSREVVRWTLEGAVPVALEDPRAASIASAAEAALRSMRAPHVERA